MQDDSYEILSLTEIEALHEVEKRHILAALKHYDGNRTLASQALHISVRTLRNKIATYRMNGTHVQPGFKRPKRHVKA